MRTPQYKQEQQQKPATEMNGNAQQQTEALTFPSARRSYLPPVS